MTRSEWYTKFYEWMSNQSISSMTDWLIEVTKLAHRNLQGDLNSEIPRFEMNILRTGANQFVISYDSTPITIEVAVKNIYKAINLIHTGEGGVSPTPTITPVIVDPRTVEGEDDQIEMLYDLVLEVYGYDPV
jgi:hypothetical protein